MNHHNQQQEAPVVYHPPSEVQGHHQGPFVAPPPLGYPMKNGPGHPQQSPPAPSKTQHRGGFCRGCCGGLCCCCLLDACF
ncbi:protein CYSTEINE-RICH TRANSMEMBRANE MODULE 6-like [Hevea brasiliensis]|uniref:protein CYSTEINE-RICH TRANSMEMBRANE MODULE 6-like n=1 Tax=Hevea brasiliensis TaxID=3981 RepID=UPI0025CC66D8|nr:protein CYSTEINE-RICH TRANSMEMBRANE MODULE 6-like [Hevea brasiliensis]